MISDWISTRLGGSIGSGTRKNPFNFGMYPKKRANSEMFHYFFILFEKEDAFGIFRAL